MKKQTFSQNVEIIYKYDDDWVICEEDPKIYRNSTRFSICHRCVDATVNNVRVTMFRNNNRRSIENGYCLHCEATYPVEVENYARIFIMGE